MTVLFITPFSAIYYRIQWEKLWIDIVSLIINLTVLNFILFYAYGSLLDGNYICFNMCHAHFLLLFTFLV